MSSPPDPLHAPRDQHSPLACFSYLNVPNAALYVSVLAVFARAREEFQLNLRAADVRARLESGVSEVELAGALDQLCHWGNLEAFHDNSTAMSLEEFYRRHLYYQLTGSGVAAIRALELFHQLIEAPAALQATALAAVRDRLAELIGLARAQQAAAASKAFDVAKASSLLDGLFSELDKLTDQAQEFFRQLQATVELRNMSVEVFLAFKERLVHYLERFLNQVVTVAGEAETLIESADVAMIDAMFQAIATHRTIDEFNATSERVDQVFDQLKSKWTGVVGWFITPAGKASQADELRALARTGIREVASAASRLNRARGGVIDRSSDLRRLAVAFAACPDARAAHRLWRAAFALSPARHFTVSEATLVERDQVPLSPTTSWTDSPPLRIAPTLRSTGRVARAGRTPRLIDNRAELAELREQSRREAEELRQAQQQLLTPAPRRLSELEPLAAAAFPLFLDLLGEALTVRGQVEETVEATSTDGSLLIRMQPTGDGGTCRVQTEEGEFCGQDFWISIHRTNEARPVEFATPGAGA